ncbi:MAG: LysM peptidoglycan-binding domain-containing protein, partial [Candidatus Electrothrix sp. AR3]|nr:LysM peptidoglycan-binding domain-containing protein [Candidatus Electrothrix sp. AR3]
DRTLRTLVKMIMRWNNITNARKVRSGSRLTIYPLHNSKQLASAKVSSANPIELIAKNKKRKPGTVDSSLAVAAPTSETIITLSDHKKQKPNAVADTTTVSYYCVRNGDSLWSIARKHQVSTSEIKRWNSLSNSRLQPGTQLVIKNT